ncbi:hypothetical protein OG225_23720 [Nocardia sp. NBC_01377]|uniref:hypothetical protein n=1 Tax=Nocardia sp. NBC_01377 TaxID=2903595 RepID=UPI00324A8549
MTIRQTETVVARARAARELGRPEHARELLGAALVESPDDPILLEEIADISFSLDRFEDALRYAGRAITMAPQRSGPHVTAALAYEIFDRHDDALRHARLAARLELEDPSALLALAFVIVTGPWRRRTRGKSEVTAVLERVSALAPDDADTHAAVAEIYQRMAHVTATREHIDAGLRADPTHADLLTMRAEFEPGRREAVATLRGLLATRPGHTTARLRLAAITWKAMMRLASWLWFFTAAVTVASLWIGPGGLRYVSAPAFAVIPIAWFGVFRTLRKQLPPGYLTRRLRRPASVAALLVLVFSGSLAEVGVALLRLDRTAAAVRGGYVLLLAAACGAGFAHLLFFLTWLGRRGGDRDAAEASGHAVVSLVFVTGGAIVLLGVIAALRHWSRQPTAFWVLVVLACGIALTLLLESAFALYPDLRPGARWIPVLVAAVAVAGMWWGAHELGSEPFRSTERLPRPTVPRFTPKPLPTMPSFRVTVPPAPRPTGDR